MSHFLSTVQSVPVEVPAEDGGLPAIHFRNANNKAGGAHGFFYTRNATPLSDPWKVSERFVHEPDGYESRGISLAIVGHRQTPYITQQKDDRTVKVYQPSYEPGRGMQFVTELLGFIREKDTNPPRLVVVVFKGLAGQSVTRKSGGILSEYRERLLNPAAQVANRHALPFWSFWLPIRSKVDATGKAVYVATGKGSSTNVPELFWLRDKEGNELDVQTLIDKLFVGEEVYRLGAQVREQYQDWLSSTRYRGPAVQNGAFEQDGE